MDEWKQQDFAKQYADNSVNPRKNGFELDLNLPSIIKMIPKDAQRVLDFGCGPGDFTVKLAKHVTVVEGCDYSEAMIKLAQDSYPSVKFFTWDYTDTAPDVMPYDVVVSKLTLHFVDDLSQLAKALRDVLKDDGYFIFSVPHPFSTIGKANDYWNVELYDTEIGTYGMNVTMIHRSLRDYIMPFVENGFTLADVVEPKITATMASKYDVPAERLIYPRRINLSFRKS